MHTKYNKLTNSQSNGRMHRLTQTESCQRVGPHPKQQPRSRQLQTTRIQGINHPHTPLNRRYPARDRVQPDSGIVQTEMIYIHYVYSQLVELGVFGFYSISIIGIQLAISNCTWNNYKKGIRSNPVGQLSNRSRMRGDIASCWIISVFGQLSSRSCLCHQQQWKQDHSIRFCYQPHFNPYVETSNHPFSMYSFILIINHPLFQPTHTHNEVGPYDSPFVDLCLQRQKIYIYQQRYINKLPMRLATEYQQKTKPTQKDQEEGRKYIVRLGKGIPQPQKRRRGISLSKERDKIQTESLGKHEMSRQKISQQLQLSKYSQKASEAVEQVVSKVAYCNRYPTQIYNYANEHLVVSPPKVIPQQMPPQNYRVISSVRSQQRLQTRVPQNITRNNYINPSKISPFTITKDVFMPIQSINSASLQKREGSQIKNIQQVKNVRFISPAINKQQIVVQKIHSSSPSSVIKVNQYKPVPKQTRSGVVQMVNIPPPKKNPQVCRQVNLESTKQINPKNGQEDPYRLVNSKVNKRVQNDLEQHYNEQLKKTKKPLRGLPQCKQSSNSSSASRRSKSQRNLLERKEIRSLWDANKVESIISMKESQQIKVEESQVMVDYFNPRQSLQRKK